jgi:cytidylate kinase
MISFVCGQLCSGKSLYSKALAGTTCSLFVEVGDIVRDLKKTTDRRILQNSKELSQQIIKVIEEKHDAHQQFRDLIVCGVRQKEIFKYFPNSTLLWIECPISIRKERYQKRARSGDTQTFEEAEQGDINLGILEVKQYILDNK